MINIFEMFSKNKSKNKKNLLDKSSSSPRASPSVLSPTTSSDTYSLEDRDSREIEKVFRYIDENGDGKISPAELQRCVKAVGAQRLSAEEAAVAVECSDSDGDGLLGLEDFSRLMHSNNLSENEKMEDLKEAFLMYNDKKDESGVITPKSLKRMLSRLGDSKSIHDCKEMIRVYDLNGDGVLSFDEFAIMIHDALNIWCYSGECKQVKS